MYSIEYLQKHNLLDTIIITEHARLRLYERGIKVADIQQVITTGTIIKQYEDDKPFPSYLILGKSKNKRPLHVVVSCDGKFIFVITAYFPNTKVWNNDFTRKIEL